MTINRKLSVETFWSEEDQEYVAKCDEYPSLSWLAESPKEAVDGLASLVRQEKEDRTTEAVLLERIEQLEENYSSILSVIDQRIVNALINNRPQQQQRPDLFWKGVKDIIGEKAADTPIRLMNFVASYAKEQGIQGGEEMYQQASDIYRSSFQ